MRPSSTSSRSLVKTHGGGSSGGGMEINWRVRKQKLFSTVSHVARRPAGGRARNHATVACRLPPAAWMHHDRQPAAGARLPPAACRLPVAVAALSRSRGSLGRIATATGRLRSVANPSRTPRALCCRSVTRRISCPGSICSVGRLCRPRVQLRRDHDDAAAAQGAIAAPAAWCCARVACTTCRHDLMTGLGC